MRRTRCRTALGLLAVAWLTGAARGWAEDDPRARDAAVVEAAIRAVGYTPRWAQVTSFNPAGSLQVGATGVWAGGSIPVGSTRRTRDDGLVTVYVYPDRTTLERSTAPFLGAPDLREASVGDWAVTRTTPRGKGDLRTDAEGRGSLVAVGEGWVLFARGRAAATVAWTCDGPAHALPDDPRVVPAALVPLVEREAGTLAAGATRKALALAVRLAPDLELPDRAAGGGEEPLPPSPAWICRDAQDRFVRAGIRARVWQQQAAYFRILLEQVQAEHERIRWTCYWSAVLDAATLAGSLGVKGISWARNARLVLAGQTLKQTTKWALAEKFLAAALKGAVKGAVKESWETDDVTAATVTGKATTEEVKTALLGQIKAAFERSAKKHFEDVVKNPLMHFTGDRDAYVQAAVREVKGLQAPLLTHGIGAVLSMVEGLLNVWAYASALPVLRGTIRDLGDGPLPKAERAAEEAMRELELASAAYYDCAEKNPYPRDGR